MVLMQHGILGSAYDFITNHPEEAPAFLLARQGYDVWLGNNRGVGPSRNHTSWDPDSRYTKKNYWDFSWQEMGDYDLPAFITLVLTKSGRENLTYIGHSQGNTQMFY